LPVWKFYEECKEPKEGKSFGHSFLLYYYLLWCCTVSPCPALLLRDCSTIPPHRVVGHIPSSLPL
jgi:hypothetical protein